MEDICPTFTNNLGILKSDLIFPEHSLGKILSDTISDLENLKGWIIDEDGEMIVMRISQLQKNIDLSKNCVKVSFEIKIIGLKFSRLRFWSKIKNNLVR